MFHPFPFIKNFWLNINNHLLHCVMHGFPIISICLQACIKVIIMIHKWSQFSLYVTITNSFLNVKALLFLSILYFSPNQFSIVIKSEKMLANLVALWLQVSNEPSFFDQSKILKPVQFLTESNNFYSFFLVWKGKISEFAWFIFVVKFSSFDLC